MKRILHISKYYAPFFGGIEQVARDVVNSLIGFAEQKVLCFNHETGDKVDFVDGVEVYRCHCQCKFFSQSIALKFGKVLKQIMTEFKPDIVIFHYPNPYVTHFLLNEIPTNTRFFVYWHLDITKQKILGKLFHFQNIALLHRADKVIATSPNYIIGSKYLNKIVDKCIVIPNCINEHRLMVTDESTSLSQKIRSEAQGKILCLAVGRHVPYKGFKYLIDAFASLDNRFVLNMIGDGELTNSLKKQAAGNPNIHFLGKVNDLVLKAYYLASDLFCFSSITKNEAFGIALAEAMYFGLPSVTFCIPGSGVNYVSPNNKTGLEVANCNVAEYSKAIKILANNDELKRKYGAEASLRVKNNFLFAQFQKRIAKLVLGENVADVA